MDAAKQMEIIRELREIRKSLAVVADAATLIIALGNELLPLIQEAKQERQK